MKLKKLISLVTALLLTLQCAPLTSLATDRDEIVIYPTSQCNPYGEVYIEDPGMAIGDDGIPQTPTVSTYYANLNDAIDAILLGFKNRDAQVAVGLSYSAYNVCINTIEADPVLKEKYAYPGQEGQYDFIAYLFDKAVAHDKNDPKGGDYTGQLYDQYGAGGVSNANGVVVYFDMIYRTTAEQEAAVDQKVAELVAQWNRSNNGNPLTEMQKIKLIYDYITANVAYDYAGLIDYTDALKYTAYGALIEGSAVCMGISILFYRLALEMGLDARVIHSIPAENHAWNIVKFGSYYFYLDATWDLDENNLETDTWFLENAIDFQKNYDGSPCHTPNTEYSTTAFQTAYPIARVSYGNYAEEDAGKIAFNVTKIGTTWAADGTWSESEYGEIDVKDTWISVAAYDALDDNGIDAIQTAKTLPIKMGMSWDEDYIYTFLQFTDKDGHVNTLGDKPSDMWIYDCVQVGFSDLNQKDANRLEYGLTKTSDTNKKIACTWADYTGSGFTPKDTDYEVTVNGNLVTYEFRTPVTAFSTNQKAAVNNWYSTCYVLSWGNNGFIHTQLGSGITGYAGKQAGNFMKFHLVNEATSIVPIPPTTDPTPSTGSSAFASKANSDKVAFTIDPIATTWAADGTWTAGEYTTVNVTQDWLTAFTSNDADTCDGTNTFKHAYTMPITMGMSWDADYLYTYLQFDDINGHMNIDRSDNFYNIWRQGSVQAAFTDVGNTGTDTLEYGLAKMTDTYTNASYVWFDYLDSEFTPGANDYAITIDGTKMTYEFRTPIAAFSKNTEAKAGDTYATCYVLSWGNNNNQLHTQLGEGVTFEKAAEKFMKVTLNSATTAAPDLNGDGAVDTDDVKLISDWFAGKYDKFPFDTAKADFNHDGAFTRADGMYLARALMHWTGYTLDK